MPDHAVAFVDAVQTTALIVMAAAQIYTMLLLRNEMSAAAGSIKRVLDGHAAIEARLAQLAQRSDRDALGDAIARAWERILKIEARLDGLEKGEPPPKGTRPTDPPFGRAAP
jgi:hypothetical protein